jgi:hypothetical protein
MTLHGSAAAVADRTPTLRDSTSNSDARDSGIAITSDILRRRFSGTAADILRSYVLDSEEIVGYGYGGSESLTLFLKAEGVPIFVRKVLSERLVTPSWDRNGRDVMLAPCNKAKAQANFLRRLPNDVEHLFPSVKASLERDLIQVDGHERRTFREHIYDMTYVPGWEVSRFIAAHRPSPQIVASLYGSILRMLRESVHTRRRRVPRGPTLEQSYFSKIEKRLRLSQRTAPRTFNDSLLTSDTIRINGREMANVPKLLSLLRSRADFQAVLEPTFHSLVVGDTNTENIKVRNTLPLLQMDRDLTLDAAAFGPEELGIRFLDPRAIGFHEGGFDTGVDDPMYDNKPWHNSLGNYDYIHGEHFDLEINSGPPCPSLDVLIHSENPYTQSYAGIERHFSPIMTAAWKLDDPDSDVRRTDPFWLVRFAFVMGTHFMAMPPFHFAKAEDGQLHDSSFHQRRPLALYAEGIKWLNLALDMLERRVHSFLGVPVVLPDWIR